MSVLDGDLCQGVVCSFAGYRVHLRVAFVVGGDILTL